MPPIKKSYILAALAALLAVLFIWRLQAESDLAKSAAARNEASRAADKISRLRASWEGNQAARSRVQSLLNEDSFRAKGNAQITQQGLKAEYKDLDANQISRLSRAVFEQPIQVKTFSIERKNDETADLSLEIVW
ncbi:MAG: hypothetical protein LBU73_02735 [Helicobacteraceae bacterium]|jgi:hydrogenase maturation factor|nr:hypothetical protein [Helicobacteraceae bacterium]